LLDLRPQLVDLLLDLRHAFQLNVEFFVNVFDAVFNLSELFER
jgi:hypothetical protein